MITLLKQTFQDIKSLKIQGATDVAIQTIKSLVSYSDSIKTKELSILKKKLKIGAKFLLSARPTEPMAQNGVKFIFSQLNKNKLKNVIHAKNCVQRAGEDFLIMMSDAGALVINYGGELVKNDDNILTHCHSWLVEQILIKVKEHKKMLNIQGR